MVTLQQIDELTNVVMDIVRDEFDLDSNSDRDDALYTKVHNAIRTELEQENK